MRQSDFNISLFKASHNYIQEANRFIDDSVNSDKYLHYTIRHMHLLAYFGLGIAIATVYLAPRAHLMLENIFADKSNKFDLDGFKKYDSSKLKQALHRLENQKLITRIQKNDLEVLQITQAGIKKILNYSIHDIKIPQTNWDGRWRIVIYDIANIRKNLQQKVRKLFKRIGFYPMQKSVYLFPYACENQIEYIRSYFNLSENIKIIVAESIEDDELYRRYFGLG